MRVLVMQSSLDGLSYKKEDYPFFDSYICKYLMPSVQSYCLRHGYDYKHVTHCDNIVKWFKDPKRPTRNVFSTLQRYIEMDQDHYDYIVSLDNDVFIPSSTGRIPLLKGHAAVEETNIKPKSKELTTFVKEQNKTNKPFINCGVQVVDKHTGKLLAQYIKHICTNNIVINDYYSDQAYINYFRRVYKDSHYLDSSWNYLVGKSDPVAANIRHYAGMAGRQAFYNDLSEGLFSAIS